MGSKQEILAVGGKLHGFKKQHLLFSCYLPPRYTALENAQFMNKLVDVINEARSKFPEAWITIGGDWNGRPLRPILQAFPDLGQVTTGPTREDSVLDIIITMSTTLCSPMGAWATTLITR